jgi:hypothetical protein
VGPRAGLDAVVNCKSFTWSVCVISVYITRLFFEVKLLVSSEVAEIQAFQVKRVREATKLSNNKTDVDAKF